MAHQLPRYGYLPGIILFFVALAIGLLTFRDYGVSWDEPLQRQLGEVSYNYVVKGDPALFTYSDRALGTGFELPLLFIEKALHLNNAREIYFCRHLITHLFFLVAALCGYVLALRTFRSQFIACVGFMLFAFHPRIYAHSFFNSKDIPFLSAFLIALLLAHLAFGQRKFVWYVLLGMACGYATSIRAMGIIFLPCIGLFLLADIVACLIAKKKIVAAVTRAGCFIAGYCAMLYVCWPYLWSSPFQNFVSAFHSLVHIAPGGKVLFMGHYHDAQALPLSYMPVWFAITVPEVWLAVGVAGLLCTIVAVAKRPGQYVLYAPENSYLLYVMCFCGPVIAMVVFKGVNIDDWRHLYFIYPSFVMLALLALHRAMRGRYRLAILAVCMAQLGITGYFMVSGHPFQQVYFNSFVPHRPEYLRNNFDLDYWGCSFKQGLEQLVAADKSDSIKINWSIPPLLNNIPMLADKDQKRIFVVDGRDKANYLITNFRGNGKVEYPDLQPVHTISVQNSTIMCIYKLH